jgi:hypothetical protein
VIMSSEINKKAYFCTNIKQPKNDYKPRDW